MEQPREGAKIRARFSLDGSRQHCKARQISHPPADRACMVAVEGRAPHKRQAEHTLALTAGGAAGGAAGAARWHGAARGQATLLLLLLLLLPGAGSVESRL